MISRIEVVHRGVDLNVFSKRSVTAAQTQKITDNWQLDGTKKVLLLPARLAQRKGHGLLIEALAKIDLATVPPFVCIFAGDISGREHVVTRLKQLSESFGLPNDLIRYPGHCDDMPAACLAADIVLMPSTVPEAFGRVAAEAQAMGTPVIVTDIGAVGETVRAQPEFDPCDITGWRVAPDNPDALAQAIVEALQMPVDEREKLKKNAIAFISKNYSTEKMTSSTLELYGELIKIHRKQG